MKVCQTPLGHRLSGDGDDVGLANRYLHHLGVRGFSPATVRTYAFHLLSFLRFEEDRGLSLATTVPSDLFDFIEWLSARRKPGGMVGPIAARERVLATFLVAVQWTIPGMGLRRSASERRTPVEVPFFGRRRSRSRRSNADA